MLCANVIKYHRNPEVEKKHTQPERSDDFPFSLLCAQHNVCCVCWNEFFVFVEKFVFFPPFFIFPHLCTWKSIEIDWWIIASLALCGNNTLSNVKQFLFISYIIVYFSHLFKPNVILFGCVLYNKAKKRAWIKARCTVRVPCRSLKVSSCHFGPL